MPEQILALDPRYDPATQGVLRFQAAELDGQLGDLKKVVEGMGVEHLEWQAEPGRNTVGMLLAHIAVVEVFWLQVAPAGLHDSPQADARIREVIGIAGDEDGMPLPPDGTHPASLSGMRLADYAAMLDDARRATHATLRSWTDADLDRTYRLEDWDISLAWTVYHVLEHLTAHLGQVRLLRREMKDAGVLA